VPHAAQDTADVNVVSRWGVAVVSGSES